MAEPSKLVAGVSAVYGEAYVRRVYGDILPIEASRIIEAADGTVLDLAGRQLQCLDTPGHARHHLCIVDGRTGGVFTGDMFGLSYRELDSDGRQFVFPTTTPTQFEPEEMRRSIARLLGLKPPAMYLTHYGQLSEVEHQGVELLRHLDALLTMARAEKEAGDERHARIKSAMTCHLLQAVREHGCQLAETEVLAIWETDLELNTQGLEVWLDSAKS